VKKSLTPLLHHIQVHIYICIYAACFQWPRGLRRGSAAVFLLVLRVLIPPVAWMFVCCECCVLSGRGLCDGLITRPESPTECGVSDCDREASIMRRPCPLGVIHHWKKKNVYASLCVILM
jgi:hypothetical protein